jgi:2-polyprenyl-3-methyl-5-hydroxy-6-metoxy-1,4-benzoquinol methylase
MQLKNVDKQWELFAQISPYYGVVIWDQFKPENLNDETIAEFFQTGETYIEQIEGLIKQHLDAGFNPRRCLDFGCGVGRLVVPMARRHESVVGVDISQGMRDEARRNCERFGLNNVEFVESDDLLSKVSGKFDFIHSYIVLQHIPARRGAALLRRMIELLEDDGVASLHFTYAKNETPGKRLKYWIHTSVPFAHNFINLVKGRKFNYPYTQINQYDLNEILEIIQQGGCEHSYLRFTNHDGLLGVILMFQKKKVGLIY